MRKEYFSKDLFPFWNDRNLFWLVREKITAEEPETLFEYIIWKPPTVRGSAAIFIFVSNDRSTSLPVNRPWSRLLAKKTNACLHDSNVSDSQVTKPGPPMMKICHNHWSTTFCSKLKLREEENGSPSCRLENLTDKMTYQWQVLFSEANLGLQAPTWNPLNWFWSHRQWFKQSVWSLFFH